MERIKKSTLDFLSELKKNNTSDWLNNNRMSYTIARKNFEDLVQNVIDEIAGFDPIFKGLEAKNCIYRLNRDLRFSADKSPYKTHFGAFIVRGGKKNADRFSGYYIHIEPKKSIIAGGAYMPPSSWLSAIRVKISENPEPLLSIINNKDFMHFFGKLDGEKLKSAPKGYPPDHPSIDLLRFKSYLVVNEMTDQFVMSDKYFDHVMKTIRTMKPLNDFLNDYL
jgi:uncharacterized protein (TIGR02453 family)